MHGTHEGRKEAGDEGSKEGRTDISEACLAVAVLTRATKIRLKSLLSLVPCGLKPEPSPGGPSVHVACATAPAGAQQEHKAELIALSYCPLGSSVL